MSASYGAITMTFEILINEHRSTRPGYEFLGHYEAGLPVYSLQIKVEVLRPVELSTVAQFVLRLIKEGVQTETLIAAMLGLDIEFVRNALIDLDRQRFITRTYDAEVSSGLLFRVSQKGLTALSKALTASYVEHFYIGADGLTGDLSVGNSQVLQSGPDLKRQGLMLMHPVPRMKPTVVTLNTALAQLATLYRMRTENTTSDDLVDIIDIEKTRILYKLVNVLVFAERASGRLDFTVFEGYEPATKYDEIFIRREREGRRVLPEDMLVSLVDSGQSRIFEAIRPAVEPMTALVEKLEEIQSAQQELQAALDDAGQQATALPIITEKTQRIQVLEEEKQHFQAELDRLKADSGSSRLISNAEHRTILLKALTDSQERIIIISPWINRDSVDDNILRLIELRLQNGVQIIIGFGMPLKPHESESDYIQSSVAKRFEQIKKRPYGKSFFIQYLGTHEKVLVCDQVFCVVTSFNWLSYRGNQGLRREKGVYSEDKNVLNSVIDDVLTLFKDVPSSKNTDEPTG